MDKSRVGQALFAPSRAITEPAERRKARMISILTLVSAALNVQGAVSNLLRGTADGVIVASVLLPAVLVSVCAYLLSRTRHVNVAAISLVIIQLLIPLIVGIRLPHGANFRPFDNMAWLIHGLLLASIMCSLRMTVVALGFALLMTALLGALGRPEWHQGTFYTALFLATTGMLIVVFKLHRDHVERDRAEELARRNEELEGLKATLEQRVAQRTEELVSANYELQRNQQTLLVTEKVASLGRLTSGIAHEMSSPLAAVRASMASARELVEEYTASIDDPNVTPEDHRQIAAELRESTDIAEQASERLASFIRSIRAQTKGQSDVRRERFDVVKTVSDALHLVGHAMIGGRSSVRFRSDATAVPLDGDSGRIAQVVTNLVCNAIDANADHGGGTVDVALKSDFDRIVLEVCDDGPGIPEAILTKIFDPLFTTKPVGKGTGLGLSIVHDIVCGHFGGSITAGNLPSRGARFTVSIPRAEAP